MWLARAFPAFFAFGLLIAACGKGSRSTPLTPDVSAPLATTATQATCLLDPAVSSTGPRARMDLRTRQVSITRPDGSQMLIIPPEAPGTGYAYAGPAIFPDAAAVVVGALLQQDGGPLQDGLWKVGAGDARQLLLPTDNGKTSYVSDPAVAPDGKRIAFTLVNVTRLDHGHKDRFEVWMVNADGSYAQKVADGRAPRWSNDGAYLTIDTQTQAGPPLDQSVLDAESFAPVAGLRLSPCSS